MGNKIFCGVVLLLWGSTMTWLVGVKILPQFFDGEPPIATLARRNAPTAWRIYLNARPSGVAITQAIPGALDSTEVHSLLKVEEVPLPEVAPKWMQGLLSRLGQVSLNMRTRTTLDTLGKLAAFDTRIRVSENPVLIGMAGTVKGGNLQLRLQSGDYTKLVDYPWHDDNTLGGELMPTSRLINLQVGKTWRTKFYNPFAPASMPLNVIEAQVLALEEMTHHGERMPMYHIVYRTAQSAGVSSADRLRSEVWVAQDGRVMRQKVAFMNAQLSFERTTDAEAKELAESLLELDRYATVTVPKVSPDSRAEAAGR